MKHGNALVVPRPKALQSFTGRRSGNSAALALWSSQPAPNPAADDALAITGSLRVEGDRNARGLAEQIEAACRAAL